MKIPKTLRCALYTRKSTEEGLEQAFNSLDAQRESCDAYVKSQAGEGWVALPTLYDDGGFSGGNMERPALKALLADIDRGLIDIVVVYKVDRLTRSLADFGKIVERFDKRGVSFVSVTQAFNTTNSMGRLTLNMLLSFAQFEREVTSERIRDKLAASKRKGMWMGGKPPFGYAVTDKKLIADPVEQPILFGIFERYLELGSVRLLRDELEAQGVASKPFISRHGRPYGGKPFDRGALYHLLQNRIYVGEVRHREDWFKGQHEGIVPLALFDRAQARLASNQRREDGTSPSSIHRPLAGLLHDDAGNRMSPTTARGHSGKSFRYYVSQAHLQGRSADAGAISRIPADAIETLVLDRIARLLGEDVPGLAKDDQPTARSALHPIIDRIDLGSDAIVIRLRRDQLDIKAPHRKGPRSLGDWRRRLPAEDRLDEAEDQLVLTVQGGPVRRGGATALATRDGRPPAGLARHDPAMLKAVARAHIWLDLLISGEARTLRDVAGRCGVQERYVRRMIPAAFLPPHELALLLDGRPGRWSADHLASEGLPLAWRPAAPSRDVHANVGS